MPDLRKALLTSGFRTALTIGRSGNLVVTGDAIDRDAVTTRVGDAVASPLGKRVAVVTRTAAELTAVIDANPITAAEKDGSRLHVMFLERPITAHERDSIEAIETGSDVIRICEREIYVWYRAGMSGSETAERLAKALTTVATDRNWNTVLKLLAAATSIDKT